MRSVAQEIAGKADDYVAQLLELRRTRRVRSVHKFKRMLCYASPKPTTACAVRCGCTAVRPVAGRASVRSSRTQEERERLAAFGARSRSRGDRAGIAAYGNPLALLGDISRAALCAALWSRVEVRRLSPRSKQFVLAWLAGEQWKLDAYSTFQRTGDTQLEPYKIIARRMLHKPENAEISSAERQLGNAASLHPASAVRLSLGAHRSS
jgi:hypothetical protein